MIQSSSNYLYNIIESYIIVFQKKEKITISHEQIEKIANNTINTWQKGRGREELIANTIQGKIAEDMFEDFIFSYQNEPKINYISYDAFRDDNFMKHAPFDGLLYKVGNFKLDECIALVNLDVNANSHGKLKAETRKYLSSNNIYTVEIKSSRIPDKDYEGISSEKFSNTAEQVKLLQNLVKRDLLVYPEYSRSLGRRIHSFNDYCCYLMQHVDCFTGQTMQNIQSTVKAHEVESKCNIYTRIFLDTNHSESIIGYFTGYATNNDFFENPRIINMYRKGKSENALYFVYPIKKCKKLINIFDDKKLWDNIN